MIVDTSAIVAIWRREAGSERLSEALLGAEDHLMSAATYLELCCVLDSRDEPLNSRLLDRLLRLYEIKIVPFTARQAELARQAYRDFGKGGGHPARLNFGDCFSYALAADSDQPLLFVGNDFGHTDVVSALTTSPGL